MPTLPTKKEKGAPTESVRRFFRNVTAEMKKVNWPNRKELTTYTIVVIITVLAVALVIWLWDLGLVALFSALGFYR